MGAATGAGLADTDTMLMGGTLGRRLFDDTTPSLPLELVSSQAFRTGVVHSTYRPTTSTTVS